MTDPQPLVVTTGDLVHPQDRRFWLEDEMFPKDKDGMYEPRFSVQEASKSFFGQRSDWLRWRMRPDKPSDRTGERRFPDGYFLLDGKPLEFKRLVNKTEDPNKITARYYTLADIEKMAHALAQQGIIDGIRLGHIVLMVRCCARLYGVGADTSIFQEDEPEEPSGTDVTFRAPTHHQEKSA